MSPSARPDSDPIRIAPYSEAWEGLAQHEAERLRFVLGRVLLQVYHIGSTAVPCLAAKPIVDLIPVVSDLEALDTARERVEAIGYEWRGEFGIAGRRFCVLNDDQGGRRLVHAHFYADGNPEIERHVAFRDYLRAHPDIAREYEALKRELAARYPNDREAYAEAKTPWILSIEPKALRFYRESG